MRGLRSRPIYATEKSLDSSHLDLFMAIIAMREERQNAQCECGGTEEPAEQVP